MLNKHSVLSRILGYQFILLLIIVSSILGGAIGFILIVIFIAYIANGRKITDDSYYGVDYEVSDPLPTKVPFELHGAYREYLKSDEWYELRKLVIKRDSHRCTRCGYIGNLQVHHTNYSGIETMSFTIDQLETVCTICHANIHTGLLSMKKD